MSGLLTQEYIVITLKYFNLIYVTLLERDSASKGMKGQNIHRSSEVTGFTSHLRLFGFTLRDFSDLFQGVNWMCVK